MIKPLTMTVAAMTVAALAVAGPAAAEAPPAPAAAGHHDQRGAVVSATHVRTFSRAQADDYVAEHNFARPHSRFDVELYRVVYRTIDPERRLTTASGLVAIPRTSERRLRVTSYTHGTISNRNDVASVAEDDTNRAVALMFGGAGLVVSAPDYLGLGLGPGQHPYGHLASSTSASADLLVATRALAAGHGIRLDRDVLVSGFSQGGTIAVDLGKALQRGAVPGFRLGKVAAVAGPYDLRRVEIPAVFDGRMEPKVATYYVAYLVTTWKRLVGLYDDPAEAFRPPYDRTVEALFDGRHSFDDIFAGLPASPAELFTPAFQQRLLHPTGRYAELLRAGDSACRGWHPKAPVRLYYGGDDREVIPANTASCLRSFGPGRAQAVDVGPIGHFESWFSAYPRIVEWFSQ